MSVAPQQRHTKRNRCPICGGADQDPRGKETRCHGFTSTDGEWVRCARHENAGNLNADNDGLYVHKMHGECRCGVQHGVDNRTLDEIEAVYPYHYENGEVGYEVVRKTGKRFLQRRPLGGGEYEWKLNGVPRTLYRLLDLLGDDADRVVHVSEGEKDADALAKRGYLATTNAGGAGKWPSVAKVAQAVLADRAVVVVADNDEPGRKHARDVAATLRGVARSVRVVRCPTAKDISDHFAAGGKLEELVDLEGEGAAEQAPVRPTLADRARTWMQGKTAEPVMTGHPTLDAACRGGFAAPRMIIVGGAPGAAKTTFAIVFAVRAARVGHAVAILAADEDIDDVMVRIGQIHGIDRYALEHHQPDAVQALVAVLAKLPNLEIFDGDEDTMEAAFDWLGAHRVSGKAGVFVGDSVQAMRTARSAQLESPRARVDDVLKTLKTATRSGSLVSLATSEIARAFYKSTKALAELNDLAAFKESGGIEYAAKTCLLMRSVKGEDNLFDVGTPKNRGGQKRVFRLRIDPATTLLSEVIIPPEEFDQEDVEVRRSAAVDRKVRADGEKTYRLIVEDPGIGSRKLRDKTRLGPPALGRALAWLEGEGRIENRPETKGSRQDPHYYPAQQSSRTDRESDLPSEEAVA